MEQKKDFITYGSVKTNKLWNRDFFLLWQGQFISSAGDVIYAIAIGFWILEITGSTALMGTLMAASLLPKIMASPFAGVVVDRYDRKRLIIAMDVVRGVMIGLITLAAFSGLLKVWMLFAVGIIVGICSAFFNPAVSSSIPDIVGKNMLIKANSALGAIQQASGIVGNSLGGFLYVFLGAPIMFLLNGFSFLFSAGTEVFIRIPQIQRQSGKIPPFLEEMKAGIKFISNFKALRNLMLVTSILNFFGSVVYVLLLPLCKQSVHLGPKSYGIIMASFTAGILAGMMLTSFVNFKPSRRFQILYPASLSFALALVLMPALLSVPVMASLIFFSGFCSAIVNIFINSTIQIVIPQDVRGRVFSLLATLTGSLIPLAYVAGGILAEFITLRPLISATSIIMGLSFVPVGFMPKVKAFVNFDSETDTLESIR
jgi:DHA3 family macrolide efflux protein-like MFS transporter